MKKELTLKSKTLISWGLFAVIFVALVLIASFCDLSISKIATKNNLPEGAYISNNGFGLFFEALGSSPIYLMIALGAVIWFWWGIGHKKQWLSVIAAVGVFIGFLLTVKDAFEYIIEEFSAYVEDGVAMGIPVDYEFAGKFYIVAVAAAIALGLSALLILAWRNVKPETNDKLFKFLFIVLGVLVGYLIIHFVKGPVGRMRFRTMNATGDTSYSGFTDWWVSNGKRAPFDGLPSDQCKSFPSGHTYSAAVIYTLVCIPDLIGGKWNKKWVKALVWAFTIVLTGLVAISRIVVGAHYMSDVLFGGTISFLMVMIMREILIFKGAHFKAVFGKAQPVAVLEAEAPAEELAEEAFEEASQEEAQSVTEDVAAAQEEREIEE